MSQQGMDGKRKLTAKDAITAGALGAVCIAIRFIFMLVAVSALCMVCHHFVDAILIGRCSCCWWQRPERTDLS